MLIHLYEDPLGFLYLRPAGSEQLYLPTEGGTFDTDCQQCLKGLLELETDLIFADIPDLKDVAIWQAPGEWFLSEGVQPKHRLCSWLPAYLYGEDEERLAARRAALTWNPSLS